MTFPYNIHEMHKIVDTHKGKGIDAILMGMLEQFGMTTDAEMKRVFQESVKVVANKEANGRN